MSTEMDMCILLEQVEGNPNTRRVQQGMLAICLERGASIEALMEYLVLDRRVPIQFVICDIKRINTARALKFARLGADAAVTV